MARLRANLTDEEGERFRTVGRLCAQAMDSAARAVRPGHSEYEIASLLAREGEKRGVQVTVNLIATDQRIFNYRHPLPTSKVMERYAMLVLCARRWGLVASVTRLVHFGPLPGELRRKAEAVAKIDAVFIAASRPGKRLGDIFEQATAAYAATGFPDEWQLHHQGGPAAYEPREYVANPGSTDKVLAGQAYAWNPSITGTKSEDTVLVSDSGYEVLTEIEGWPALEVEIEGEVHNRPAILEIL
jgi:antitoxin VapB